MDSKPRIDTEFIIERMDALLEQADGIWNVQQLGHGTSKSLDRGRFAGWAASVAQVVKLSFGVDSHYYTRIESLVNGSGLMIESAPAGICLGILQAARDDLAAGMLVKLEELAAVEVFDDMLEMALHLHENGYHVAAVSIVGAVLEDALRKLYAREIGPLTGESKINVLNEALREHYSQATWRQIQTWGDMRNDADHGKYSNSERQLTLDENGDPYPVIDPRDVRRMIDWTRDFMEKHLT